MKFGAVIAPSPFSAIHSWLPGSLGKVIYAGEVITIKAMPLLGKLWGDASIPLLRTALQDGAEDSLLAKASPDLVLLALEMQKALCRDGEGREDSAIWRLPLLGQR